MEPSATDCVPAPVAMARLPALAVVDVGLNRTVTVQLLPTATEVPHVVDTKLKSAPVTEPAAGTVTDKGPTPLLLSVAVAVLLEPTGVAGNVGPDNAAACACPVPDRLMEVTPVPLCVRLSVPERLPVWAGVKLTLMVQVLPTATLVQLLVCANSVAPALMLTALTVSVCVPLLVTVTALVPDVLPTWVAANDRLAGEATALPWMPLAARDAFWVPAPVATDSCPLRAVVDVGLKRTVTTQASPTATEVPHVVDTKLKSVPVTEPAVGAVTDSGPTPVLLRVATAVLEEPTAVAANVGMLSDAEAA